ncbi:MAG TPA: hypothetical protein VK966_05825 [Longimicrobiales bacterium]|nr:hypothetical protein [Longimicrobiales bacterium]
MMRRSTNALILAFLLTGACGPPEDQETGSLSQEDVTGARADLDPAVAAALDSGSTAYRAGDFEEALRQYQEAARLDDQVAAAWFGVAMAQGALGNVTAADSAMERARELAPGASLIHPERD